MVLGFTEPLAAGLGASSVPPMEAYKAFRGQAPTTEALLKRRGLN
ncbi:hypothetical protein [Shewanella algidipiscicola]|uniref:Uncharacterized protein n=1 Tax=Shewanella algidipiscicola TaxID=614070 RepID=A0ABQ4NTK8_9GAMM|nr:hypothetical protein TUM4630_36370 [Shewanella algidipiscicola]